ncbi:GFA family protein [Scytonema sp. PRP1]|uniref:GFA family protein n=1 Tax=Scytonema sp. PRP1 TaxID=3120513 RepID=UPI003FA72D17
MYDGELGAANYCHCRDCRKTTGSAFNIGVRLQSAALRIVAGQVSSTLSILLATRSHTLKALWYLGFDFFNLGKISNVGKSCCHKAITFTQ